MSPETKTAIRAVALQGEEASAEITRMLRQLLAINEREPLPEGFLDHQLDLKSARATLDRVCDAMRAATAAEAVRA